MNKEPVIALDTALGGLNCFLCHHEILAAENLVILSTGYAYWPAHWDCFEATT
jgi:hypothetical protein